MKTKTDRWEGKGKVDGWRERDVEKTQVKNRWGKRVIVRTSVL